jgi:hypothetical protein
MPEQMGSARWCIYDSGSGQFDIDDLRDGVVASERAEGWQGPQEYPRDILKKATQFFANQKP